MGDLINRKTLLKEMTCLWDEALGTCACVLEEDIKKAPAVDAVEIVRCKDCALRGDPENCPMCAHRFEIVPDGLEFCYSNNTEDDGFCHKGVKMGAGD